MLDAGTSAGGAAMSPESGQLGVALGATSAQTHPVVGWEFSHPGAA